MWSRCLATESRHFGVLTATEWNRVTRFVEKPPTPATLPGRPDSSLASMGIYVFNTELLEKLLLDDAADENRPRLRQGHPAEGHRKLQVFAYPFQDVKTRAQSYWRDVGTVDAFYDANIELVHVRPELNIYDEEWPIWTYQEQPPPAKFVLDEDARRGHAINSMVSGGCIVSGACARVAPVFERSRRGERRRGTLGRVAATSASDSELPDPQRHHRRLPAGTRIGHDRNEDSKRFLVTDKGVVLVTPDMLSHG